MQYVTFLIKRLKKWSEIINIMWRNNRFKDVKLKLRLLWGYSIPGICLGYEFDRWPDLTYCTYKTTQRHPPEFDNLKPHSSKYAEVLRQTTTCLEKLSMTTTVKTWLNSMSPQFSVSQTKATRGQLYYYPPTYILNDSIFITDIPGGKYWLEFDLNLLRGTVFTLADTNRWAHTDVFH